MLQLLSGSSNCGGLLLDQICGYAFLEIADWVDTFVVRVLVRVVRHDVIVLLILDVHLRDAVVRDLVNNLMMVLVLMVLDRYGLI